MSCPDKEIEMGFKGLGSGEERDLNLLPLTDKSKKAQEACKCLVFVHGGCVGSKLMLPVAFHLEPKYLTTKALLAPIPELILWRGKENFTERLH